MQELCPRDGVRRTVEHATHERIVPEVWMVSSGRVARQRTCVQCTRPHGASSTPQTSPLTQSRPSRSNHCALSVRSHATLGFLVEGRKVSLLVPVFAQPGGERDEARATGEGAKSLRLMRARARGVWCAGVWRVHESTLLGDDVPQGACGRLRTARKTLATLASVMVQGQLGLRKMTTNADLLVELHRLVFETRSELEAFLVCMHPGGDCEKTVTKAHSGGRAQAGTAKWRTSAKSGEKEAIAL